MQSPGGGAIEARNGPSNLSLRAAALALRGGGRGGPSRARGAGGEIHGHGWKVCGKRRKTQGLNLHLIYTGEEWGDLSGGLRRGQAFDGLLKLTLQLDLEKLKLTRQPGWTLFTSFLYPHGPGLSTRYVGDYHILSNIDAYDSPRLFEAFVQWEAEGQKVTIRAGQLSVDNFFYVSDNSNLYINSVLGTLGTVLHDVMVPIYPVGALGVHVTLRPSPPWTCRRSCSAAIPGDQARTNKNGLRFAVSERGGALALGGGLRAHGRGAPHPGR